MQVGRTKGLWSSIFEEKLALSLGVENRNSSPLHKIHYSRLELGLEAPFVVKSYVFAQIRALFSTIVCDFASNGGALITTNPVKVKSVFHAQKRA